MVGERRAGRPILAAVCAAAVLGGCAGAETSPARHDLQTPAASHAQPHTQPQTGLTSPTSPVVPDAPAGPQAHPLAPASLPNKTPTIPEQVPGA